MSPDQLIQVRRFNRLVTQRVGALEDHFLGRDRPLGESRLLFEIGPGGAELRDLQAKLGLDSGYLSRLIGSLKSQGLIDLSTSSDDERSRRAQFTTSGLEEYKEMERRADHAATALLEPLSPAQQGHLVSAMAEVERMLRAAGIIIRIVSPSDRGARWCVAQYFQELARRFEEGFEPSQSLPADDDDLVPPRGAFLLATLDGRAVASSAIKTIEPGVGSLKRMWVAETVRGLGLGKRMLRASEAQARHLGIKMLRLETNRALKEAINLYKANGYREVPAFNDDPYANHWFEKTLY